MFFVCAVTRIAPSFSAASSSSIVPHRPANANCAAAAAPVTPAATLSGLTPTVAWSRPRFLQISGNSGWADQGTPETFRLLNQRGSATGYAQGDAGASRFILGYVQGTAGQASPVDEAFVSEKEFVATLIGHLRQAERGACPALQALCNGKSEVQCILRATHTLSSNKYI